MNNVAQKVGQNVKLGLALASIALVAACANVPSDNPFRNGDIYGYSPVHYENVQAISNGELHFSE